MSIWREKKNAKKSNGKCKHKNGINRHDCNAQYLSICDVGLNGLFSIFLILLLLIYGREWSATAEYSNLSLHVRSTHGGAMIQNCKYFSVNENLDCV